MKPEGFIFLPSERRQNHVPDEPETCYLRALQSLPGIFE